ncbi:alpha/beta hydrolase [Chitinophaga pendula]|uniref:alpha/beta fold hydrolase n=1 Tax=Chitinophaga TaxID=79328 RepID=UPI0012FE0B2C|nr:MULTISPECIES: alpha/beta hydrolase [Chitinophaga]UCJ09791.1 alpha/beta hydrolase [Chitinophaga pendula]
MLHYVMSRYAIIILFSTALFMSCQSRQLTRGEQTLVTNDSISLRYKVSGKGMPCIFVHGGPGGGYLSFEKMGGDKLEDCLTMVYYDQRGSGSAPVAADYRLQRMVQDIEELRRRLGVDKILLMSHSFGGIILMEYALRYPQHVSGLILVNSTLHFLNGPSTAAQIEYGYHLLGKDTTIQETNPDSLFSMSLSVRSQMSKQRIGYKFLTEDINTIIKLDSLDERYPRTNDFANKLFEPIFDPSKPTKYPEYRKDYTEQTTAIKAPVLVITGKKDYAIGVAHYKRFRFPHQQVVPIDGGHLLYYENNAAFKNAVCRFVQQLK